MLPWGHGSIGYLLFSWYTRRATQDVPGELPIFAVLFGTQFPDLVDKPLAWTFGLIPSGRLIGHSLLVLVLVTVIGHRVTQYYGVPEVGVGFGIGAVSHALIDALPPVFWGDYLDATFLAWPLLPPGSYDEHERSILAYLLNIELTTMVGLEFVLTGVALVVWWYDDMPGLAMIRGMINRVTQHVEP